MSRFVVSNGAFLLGGHNLRLALQTADDTVNGIHDEAFSVAVKSGADLTTLEVREYPLNKVAICIYLIFVLGVLWVSAQNELKYFYPLNQS